MTDGSLELSVKIEPFGLNLPYSQAIRSTEDAVRERDHGSVETARQVVLTRSTVRADVTLIAHKRVKLKRLEAEFVSKQLVVIGSKATATEHTIYRDRINIVTTTSAHDSITLNAGKHEFAVSFEVPSWLCATFTSHECRVGHFVRVRAQVPAGSFFALKPQTVVALAELVVQRTAPPMLNTMRYWAGERKASNAHIAVKSLRDARIGGRLRLSLSVRAPQAVEQCRIDLVQEEKSVATCRSTGLWATLPTAACQGESIEPSSRDLRNDGPRSCSFPLPTIVTDFPVPLSQNESAADRSSAAVADVDEAESESFVGREIADDVTPTRTDAADRSGLTASNMTLVFRLNDGDLKPDYESPLFQCKHKLRIRLVLRADNTTGTRPRQVVFSLPVRLFQGDATCDDVPPCYDEIEEDYTAAMSREQLSSSPLRERDQNSLGPSTPDRSLPSGVGSPQSAVFATPPGGLLRRRSRADSVSTLPLYEPRVCPAAAALTSYEEAMAGAAEAACVDDDDDDDNEVGSEDVTTDGVDEADDEADAVHTIASDDEIGVGCMRKPPPDDLCNTIDKHLTGTLDSAAVGPDALARWLDGQHAMMHL
ncbi:hypothetical protein PYCC9005_005390 [Savitreella phatthalungensis]